MRHTHTGRVRLLRARLADLRADCFLTLHPANVFYLCGFTGSSAALLVEPGNTILFTDSRYSTQARQEVRSTRIQIVGGSLLAAIAAHLGRKRASRIAFEASRLTVTQSTELRAVVRSRIRLVPTSGLVEALRQVKSDEEINLIRRSACLTLAAFNDALTLIRPGIREFEIAAELEFRMRRCGASGPSFETIVASGRRAALPHARATSKVLRKNELVVLDLGAILHGYCSDLTRTVYLGRAPAMVRAWYRAVWEAQQAAHDTLRRGVVASQIDAAARGVLERAGLARWFVHSTGHGLGLEVHEYPKLAKGQSVQLQVGNVLTIEPGIYVESLGGIRIEDDFAVLPRGARALTKSPSELLEL